MILKSDRAYLVNMEYLGNTLPQQAINHGLYVEKSCKVAFVTVLLLVLNGMSLNNSKVSSSSEKQVIFYLKECDI